MTSLIGQTVSHYTGLEHLGGGSMGVVYKAEDTRLKRTVALKFLPPALTRDPVAKERFIHEAQAASALQHDNICTIHDIDETDDGELFIVMDMYDGETLKKKIERGPLPLAEVRAIAVQIAEGLAEAHQHGLIHRDIKPANIMVTHRGEAKILDFGLAKLAGQTRITKTGLTVGTAAYMSPEQIQDREVDHRSDIWSLGVVVYEMITGQLPFRGTYEPAIFYSILNQPPPLAELPGTGSPDWGTIITRCLEKDPAKRFHSASELLSDLTPPGRVPALERGVGTFPGQRPAQKPRHRFRTQELLLGGVGVIVGIVLVLALTGRLNLNYLSGIHTVPVQQHLVVLPFTSIGGNSSTQPFCDGLVETMTSKLGQVSQFHRSLWVVPASEVRRNKLQSPGDARQFFGANLVVAGNLQLLGSLHRLTLNLIDATNLHQLNSSVIDFKQEDMVALQDQTVMRLLEMLNLELNPQGREVIKAGRTSVPLAYELYLQGLGYLTRYDDVASLDLAIRLFKSSIEKDSLYAPAHSGLGEAYWRRYEAVLENQWVGLGVEAVEKAYHLNSRLPEVNTTLGMIHAGTGKSDEAIKDFQRALEVDATNAAAHGGLAKAYEAKGELANAEAAYRRAITLKPDYWGGYNDLGVYFARHARYEDAIGEFQKVVDLTPDNDRGYGNLGGIYYMLKRWPEARLMFERSLALKKTYRVCSNLATLYYKEGEYTRAARIYETALELNDKDYRVWGNLGAAYYWSAGEREKSAAAVRHAIALGERRREVNRQDADVTSRLAGYHATLGDKKETLSLIEDALGLAPDNAEVMFQVGAAYEQIGDRDRALKWIGQAVRNGYSLAEIEHEPELRLLLQDKRVEHSK